MRILHVNKFFDLHGGAEVYMHELMQKQREAGHEVHAFSTTSEKNLASADAGAFVTRYDLGKRHGLGTDAVIAANYLWNLEARRAMAELLDRIKPDVVHLHNIYNHLSTSVLAPIRKRGIRCVQTLHDYKVVGCANYKMYTQGAPCERCKTGDYRNVVRYRCVNEALLPNVLAALEMGLAKTRLSYEKTVQTFLCPSKFMREKMEDWGQPPGKLTYAPNPTAFPAAPAPRGGGYVLYAGRLSAEKGLRSFVEAAARIPELPVKFVGRGPEESALRTLADQLGATNLEFVGFLPPAELARVRARAEAVLLPTLMYENCSGSLLEAMADGIPCLATRIGGNPELVTDGENGYLVTPGDVDDWVRNLRRFLAAPKEVRDAMGREGRARIHERHTWEAHLRTVLEAYHVTT